MSNALALAAVSAVIKDLLDNALIDHSVSAAVGGAVTVSALPPDRIEVGDNEAPRLNLFLYHVSHNAALRNMDLPARDANGRRANRPRLALDLHYLLSAYSAEDFQAEILLGYAMLLLHETPVLTRDAIRRTLAAPSPVTGAILPPALTALSASRLADQLEMVKLSPHPLNTEEVSRLWPAFQAHYRPSVAYLASVVLIESELPVRSALPVLSRGEVDPLTMKDRGVVVQSSLVPPYAALDAVTPETGQLAVRMGERVTLSGRNLEGDSVAARFTHVRSSAQLELGSEPNPTATSFEVRMPVDPPAGPLPPGSPLDPLAWRAGVYAVAAVIRRAGEPDRVTNALPLVLAPRIASPAVAATPPGSVTVSLNVSPPVHADQAARLVVGQREVPAQAIAGTSASALSFISDQLSSGPQWLRLRVDEAESILVDRSTAPPVFDPTQAVVVP